MPNVYEDIENTNTPPDAVVIRRAGSCSDLQRLASARPSKDERLQRKKTNRWNRVWEALDLSDSGVELERAGGLEGNKLESYDEQLLDASQGEYLYAMITDGNRSATLSLADVF